MILLTKISNRITHYLERFLLGGAKNQLLFIAVVIFLVSIVAGLTVHLLYPGSSSFKDAVWWAFLRLSDPGYLGDDQGLIRRLVSTIVTVLGYVLFMGSLVAIMTQWLNGTIKKLEMGLTPLSIRGHVVILGWTNRTPIIVREFLLSEERMNRFLRTIKKSKLRVVILTEEVTTSIVQELKDELGDLYDPVKIILRSGSPLRIDHVKRVDILHAGIVIIPGANFAYGGSENMDTRSIKAMMSIHQFAQQEKMDSPDVVAEIVNEKMMPVIKSVYQGNADIIAGDIIISKIITQNVRHHGLAVVYDELLSNEGNEIYVREASSFSGKAFGDIGACFPEAIPIGLIKSGQSPKAYLNPSIEMLIGEEDKIVLLSEEYNKTKHYPVEVVSQSGGKIDQFSSRIENKKESRILVVGWNHKIPVLFREMLEVNHNISVIDNFSVVDCEERMDLLNKHNLLDSSTQIRCLTGNRTHHEDLKQLDLKSYTEIIMLANDWMDSGEEADARTIMGYIMLKKEMGSINHYPSFIVELMDPDNRSLVAIDDDVIITPLLISYSLSQVALNRDLHIIYDELIASEGTDISLVSAEHYNISCGVSISFEVISEQVQLFREIAIGLSIFNEGEARTMLLNPGKDYSLILKKEDQIIVLSNFIETV